MKEIEMERGMGEMEMWRGRGERSFYMRVGIFVSMYFTFPYLIPPKKIFP